MTKRPKAVLIVIVCGATALAAATDGVAAEPPVSQSPCTVDFRYAPPAWQTAICLPDDWQKTLVAEDGGVLYDSPGRFAGFKTKITIGGIGEAAWLGQELPSARIPIVKTRYRVGRVEATTEVFAVTPDPKAKPKPPPAPSVQVVRVGENTYMRNWASPKGPCDPGFRNIAVGWKTPIHYRFAAKKGERYTVALGLCEGHHGVTGQRLLDLQIEGKTRHTVDMVAAKGQNTPAVFAFEAIDANGDGWVDVKIAAAANSPDVNPILNTLWVFGNGSAPTPDELVAGKSRKKALAYLDCGGAAEPTGPVRHDVMVLRMVNRSDVEVVTVPSLTIESEFPIAPDEAKRQVRIGANTTLSASVPIDAVAKGAGRQVLVCRQIAIAPGKERALAFCITKGPVTKAKPVSLVQAKDLRARAEKFWSDLDLPYGRINVPDAGVQSLIDSSIRNIYQAREVSKGLPVFQTGPTHGLRVVDASFIIEAVTLLGRVEDARNGIKYLLGRQRKDGAIMIADGHLKETGIALWAVARHARLTGDKAWLGGVWPQVERGIAFLHQLRKQSSAKPDAPNAGLMPDGFSDVASVGKTAAYTSVYWTLAGMRAGVEAARWLGRASQADAWQKEYDDLYATFRRAAKRDTREDGHGNAYLPILMAQPQRVAPQRGQGAFLHAVFPGEVFAADDPLVRGNMAMLKAGEGEGLVHGTGTLAEGVSNAFGASYGHAWLWAGQGRKAAEVLYALANHASPLLAWCDEQTSVGKGRGICGEMPDSDAGAGFIRLVRHLLLLERGDALHLFEGLPAAWARPGTALTLKDVATAFGPTSLELRVADDGKTARLKMTPPKRTVPNRIVLHLDGWSARAGTLDLLPAGPIDEKIKLKE